MSQEPLKSLTIEEMQKLDPAFNAENPLDRFIRPDVKNAMPRPASQILALEKDIEERGIRNPLTFDPETGEVHDGTNRLLLCRKHGFREPFVPEWFAIKKHFETLEDRLVDIIRINLTTKELNDYQRAQLILRAEGFKIKRGGNIKKEITTKDLAEQAQLQEWQIEKVRYLNKHATPEKLKELNFENLFEELENGNLEILEAWRIVSENVRKAALCDLCGHEIHRTQEEKLGKEDPKITYARYHTHPCDKCGLTCGIESKMIDQAFNEMVQETLAKMYKREIAPEELRGELEKCRKIITKFIRELPKNISSKSWDTFFE